MKKPLYWLALLLTLGLLACNKQELENEQGDTFVGITLAFPGSDALKALPNDYNDAGTWEGEDIPETVSVFMVNETAGTVDYTSFSKDDFNNITDNKLTPTKAVKATAGHAVKAYVVINDKNDKVTTRLKGTAAAQFATAFEQAVDIVATEVASYNTSEKDVIMMTNELAPTATILVPNVSPAEAISGPNNHIVVRVSRIVSRAIVTMKNNLMDEIIVLKNANNLEGAKVKITKVAYSVGASNKKAFIIHKSDWSTPEPLYSFNPTDVATWKAGWAGLDYSQVENHTTLQQIASKDLVKGALSTEKDTRKFVLPVTHPENQYKKGNTTYFEILCEFTPDEIDGVPFTAPMPEKVYLGTNDLKFYSTREKAEEKGQKATEYYKGIMKYVIWLNPDKAYNGTDKITKSPTVRNQIYHAHISAFKGMGVPNNPINPGKNPDPNSANPPVDPNNPNPDPQNPNNPIKPEDPLQVKDTHLSVEIEVLDWTIHSYEVAIDSNIY